MALALAGAKSPISHFSSLFFLRSKPLRFPFNNKCIVSHAFLQSKPLSSPPTPYPLQYDLILSRPDPSSSRNPRRLGPTPPCSKPKPKPTESPSDSDSDSDSPESSLNFEDWVDKKLTQNDYEQQQEQQQMGMDKAKRKYYNKRRRRMYGSDSEDEMRKRDKHGFVELKPEVVEFRTLHKREQELYFYDTFALPWEKDKHYKMVYQLEKKYFPDQCLDNAFLQPGQSNSTQRDPGRKKKNRTKSEMGEEEEEESKGLVFFDGEKENDGNKDFLSEKKVEEFFKCLKKVPSKKGEEVSGELEPFLASTTTGLPPQWDTPAGTVVLVNKPKGWTSFTVCGKLRRLTKVKKVGHAGTLDPMATGLLIVCVGKATKLVDRYQGMIKGYSGVFRLGEATSTWDADSPVIQREPWEHIKDEDVKKAVASFTGEIWQVPPMFSAIKVGGEKMYEKARRGESIELSPRRISIFQFDIERSLEDRQNLIFRVTCSKGTYIRSLCADFGKALGSCAHLIALRRDSIGEYTADDAYDFQELEEQITKGYF